MNFIPGAARQRSRQFDAIVEATVGVLEHPVVRQELGQYGAHLLMVANRLVLPNIHHGRAKFPTKLLASDSFGLIPLRRVEQNAGLHMDVSMYEPTQRRRAQSSEQEVRRAAGFIATHEPRSPVVTAPAHTHATVYEEASYVSRPLIFLHPLMVEGNSTPSRGRTVVHELVHADDADILTEYNVTATVNVARDELHAYCIEAVAERAMEGCVSNDFGSLSKPLQVEALNNQYGNPNPPTQELVEALQDHMII
jgi:hypothetical protein